METILQWPRFKACWGLWGNGTINNVVYCSIAPQTPSTALPIDFNRNYWYG
ncbi:hypothetical protein AM1_F0098 (plasmid) [Acaryochloris marina MBIC11017]|uniref:Uncharacterized protein n=1 Tax=Acaryochloris marina (strain MBIC 11017) TaxID=329726 RepID=A8ZQ80_ACAM1|nr:hypothetical protein AM1_F0098 [Acaryochloris marina MBIC11017]